MPNSRKKRKIGYIDRSVIIENQTKKQNVVDGAKAEAVNIKFNSPERFFTHKLVKYNDMNLNTYDPSYCQAYVMNNEICVLVAPIFNESQIPVSVTFQEAALRTGENISGRRKKGAWKCNESANILSVKFNDDSVLQLKTPVGGQVLEINEKLNENPDMMRLKRIGEGFVAIIYPNTKLPSL